VHLLTSVFVLFYLLTISIPVFIIFTIGFAGAFVFFFKKGAERVSLNATKVKQQDQFLLKLNQLLKGFKAIQLNHLKATRTLKQYTESAQNLSLLSTEHRIVDLKIKGEFEVLSFGIMIGCVFLLPFSNLGHDDILALVTTLLFILPLMFIALVFCSALEDTISDINELEQLYNSVKEKKVKLLNAPRKFKPTLQEKLVLSNIQFSYQNKAQEITYWFGPVNLTIKKGELLFIVGGNGSGKSTLLKLLTGLYQANAGKIMWDNKEVGDYNLSTYKELFSIIFTDFHLFEKLYGLPEINKEHVKSLLHLMELINVTNLQKDRVSSLSLSTGQKKRLAMLTAFLDNKEIYILDEVAADQDPTYRKFFYYTVLPELKKAGKTVLVVSHDDHYFHIADRIMQMKEGKIYHYQPPTSD